MLPSSTSASPTSRRRLLETLHPLGDAAAWNRLMQRLDPVWSLSEIRAQVVARVEESTDTVSLWLKPNRRWTGHQAGQHVLLGVEIDGVRRQRVFSLSSAARSDRLLRITLQRQAPGGVTEWLHAHAQKGLVVELCRADGAFTLPDPVPEKLLMIAGGSGITPLLAMLHELADLAYPVDIELFQLFRDSDQRLFAGELAELSGRLPGLRICTHSSAAHGRLDALELASRVSELDRRHTLMCGPEALMANFSAAWTRLGLERRLQTERFGAPRPTGAGSESQIYAVESEHLFTQPTGLSLLESAEAAGLQPKFGCRAGICRTCLCRKSRGRVRNLLTGLVSSQPDEWVQLCVSVAESDVELSL